jgi:hypothetical protein
MKKPFGYRVMSNKKCGCGKGIKANLLAKKPNATQCFRCWYPAEIKRRGGVAFAGRTGRQVANG